MRGLGFGEGFRVSVPRVLGRKAAASSADSLFGRGV